LSTILKALKRIDQTSPPPEDLQSWPPIIDTKETVRTRVHKIRLYRKLYLALILMLVVIAAGWLIFNQKHRFISDKLPQNTSERGPIYQAKIYPVPGDSETPANKGAPERNRQAIRATANAEPNRAGVDRPSRSLPSLPQRQNNKKNPILASSKNSQPLGKTTTSTSIISRSQTTGVQKSIQSNKSAPAAAPVRKPISNKQQAARSYRRLHDAKLELQAIAWSSNAAQRIAVINGHIIREGESVEGFSVNQIRREDVIVNDGTESWRLEFGLK
jgi:hypothetical protein